MSQKRWILAICVLVFAASSAFGQTKKALSPFQLCVDGKSSYDQRIEYCTSVIEASTASREQRSIAYTRRSGGYLNSGQVDLAIIDASKALNINPNLSEGYISRASAYKSKKDFDSAISDYSKAISISNVKDPYVYLSRALAYSDKGEPYKAILDLNVTIPLLKTSAEAYFYRGFMYEKVKNFDRALSDYSASIRLQPKLWTAYFRRATVYHEIKQTSKAIEDLNKSIELQPNNADSFFMRGLAYYVSEDWEKAALDFGEAVRLDPTDAVSYESRAEVNYILKKYDQSISDYDAALRITPGREKYVKGRERSIAARAREAPGEGSAATAEKPATPKIDISPADVLPTGRRVALVIGNSAYRAVSALPNPAQDVELVSDAMRRAGIDVTTAHDLDRAGMVQALKAFAEKADAADWAMIYYAGHGMEVAGTNYLIPIDAQLRNDRDVSDEAITLQRLLSATEGARKLRLVVLDACRNNPFASQMKMAANSRAVSRGLARVEPENGTLVVYAAKEGTTADDGGGTNSPFAASFAKRITEPGVEINMTFRLVRQDVMKVTGNKQEPFTYGALPPEGLYFAGGP